MRVRGDENSTIGQGKRVEPQDNLTTYPVSISDESFTSLGIVTLFVAPHAGWSFGGDLSS